jgi:hypothetical protein
MLHTAVSEKLPPNQGELTSQKHSFTENAVKIVKKCHKIKNTSKKSRLLLTIEPKIITDINNESMELNHP